MGERTLIAYVEVKMFIKIADDSEMLDADDSTKLDSDRVDDLLNDLDYEFSLVDAGLHVGETEISDQRYVDVTNTDGCVPAPDNGEENAKGNEEEATG